MALSQVYTAVIGHVITAARWNNEFGNIYANGTDVAFPLTKAVSLNGFTLTLDSAGVTTLSSTASQAFVLTPGVKSGTPSVNGNFFNLAAATFTDTNTAGSGTAALWAGASFRAPTLAATNTVVTTTDACTVYIDAPIAGTNETFTETNALYVAGKIKLTGDLRLRGSDSRTNSIIEPFTIQMQTSGTPAAGIGTGMAFVAESADEAPSNLGALDFSFTDVGAGTEDSRMSIKTRVAGAAIAETFSWQATGAFSAKTEHANTADRTYTLPNASYVLDAGDIYKGPSSTGSGSTAAHEGTVTISGNQALDGVHYYTDFTLNAGITVTLDDSSHSLIIVATGTLTINGTIDALGAGSAGGAGGIASQPGAAGTSGFSQPGAGGGAASADSGGAGGAVLVHSIVKKVGGTAGAPVGGAGGTGSQLSGDAVSLSDYTSLFGGAGGGGGGSDATGTGGAGGRGGGSIVLVAPTVILAATATLLTSGAVGSAGVTDAGGGGGGGGGNVYIYCRSYTDSGATFTLTGGAGGAAASTNGAGGTGAAGVKQINIYA